MQAKMDEGRGHGLGGLGLATGLDLATRAALARRHRRVAHLGYLDDFAHASERRFGQQVSDGCERAAMEDAGFVRLKCREMLGGRVTLVTREIESGVMRVEAFHERV